MIIRYLGPLGFAPWDLVSMVGVTSIVTLIINVITKSHDPLSIFALQHQHPR